MPFVFSVCSVLKSLNNMDIVREEVHTEPQRIQWVFRMDPRQFFSLLYTQNFEILFFLIVSIFWGLRWTFCSDYEGFLLFSDTVTTLLLMSSMQTVLIFIWLLYKQYVSPYVTHTLQYRYDWGGYTVYVCTVLIIFSTLYWGFDREQSPVPSELWANKCNHTISSPLKQNYL